VPGRVGAAARGVAPLPEVVVDYAHTPDALEKALVALRPFARERGGRLWCVFGCGGNRDASKRPLMGALAERLADHVVITSDNPRDEPPNFIISQILVGVIGHDDVDVMDDRLAAIAYAVQAADARDVVLVAGKGHEDSQEIAGVKHPCSDVAMARSLLAARAAGGAA
jgi:UDP-N-acetylmuramoyl-L-alanyl-D-glutamate--2,6-diaminopimelate ligase